MNYSKELLDFIEKSPSQYHVVENAKEILADFTELKEDEEWQLAAGGKYYCVRKDSALIAFILPTGQLEDTRIVASHSDSPAFKIKPNADEISDELYTKLNTEKYGGMLMAQWLDRPLSIAGRVIVKKEDSFKSILVDTAENICIIPSVAIHMNREANSGYKYDPKVDTIPLYGSKEAKGLLYERICESAKCTKEDILGADLFLYNKEAGRLWGKDEEFISSRALDDLQCAYSSLIAMSQTEPLENRLNICAIFDNEEVGSSTMQGADSTFLPDLLDRIEEELLIKHSSILRSLSKGYMISADNAHAVHPNHPEYADKVNKPRVNGGIVIKYQAGGKYTTDAYSEAMLRDICKKVDVPVQEYTNRSDLAGGSTLGNILNTQVSIKSIDIGLAQLAMHSPYETAGSRDTEYLIKALGGFYIY